MDLPTLANQGGAAPCPDQDTAVRVDPPGSVQGYRMRSLNGRPANFGSEALVLQM
jgi:hypothetical protein